MRLTRILSHFCRVSLCLAMMLGCFQLAGFATTESSEKNNQQSAIWQLKTDADVENRGRRFVTPEKYLVYGLDRNNLKQVLDQSPLEFTIGARIKQTVLEVPSPEGGMMRFRVEESPIFSPEVAAQFPDWKTYQGYGIDDPTTTARFDFTPSGFHAYIFTTKGTLVIDPYQENDRGNYVVYSKNHLERSGDFHCSVEAELNRSVEEIPSTDAPSFSHGLRLQTYRIAIATTGEYTAFFGGAMPAFNQVVISLNRIIGVYRKELAVSFTLVSTTNTIYTTTNETPANYANNGSSADLNANQTNLDSIIGSANYDIGHVFQTGFGGIAQLSSVCGSGKGRGLSGLPNPVGDPFDVDFVAHELGHQFGANHTFNSPGNCGSSPAAARMEGGSAVTIMGYAGICSGNANVQRNSIETFHIYNLTESINFVNGAGSGCGTFSTGTPNAIPVIAPLTNYTIPINTPFALTASATDGDGDALTYDWQQFDAGASTSSYAASTISPGTGTDDDDISLANRPGLRPYLPTTGGTRMFPSLPYILSTTSPNEPDLTFTGTSLTGSICAGRCITGEDLPSAARTMNFRVAVRDGRGGIADAGTVVTVANTTTPFRVTTQNTASTWTGNSTQTVTWDVSSTNTAPISAANVKISLSTDGGQTFPTTILASTPNDGSETITVPNIATTQARIKIEAVGNIFFDVNNVNFTINAVVVNNRTPFDYDGDGKADVSVFRPSDNVWYLLRSQTGFTGVAFGAAGDKIVPADFDGDGKTDLAVFRPSNGTWYLLQSTAGFTGIQFGAASDIPVPADYDGDGKADVAVFRPSNGTWYLNRSTAGFTGIQFGANGDKPVSADYDGDNKADVAVFRPSNGTWYLLQSTAGFTGIQFGANGDIPVPANYDGDNKSDVAVFRPSNGTWYLNQSTAGFTGIQFGTNGDLPTAADYDGDGKADVAVFRGGVWYLNRTTAGFTGVAFGAASDRPTPNAFIIP